MLFLKLPAGGAKDVFFKKMPLSLGGHKPMVSNYYEGEKRDVERETIFIMKQRSLTGKHNYGQTVATA